MKEERLLNKISPLPSPDDVLSEWEIDTKSNYLQ